MANPWSGEVALGVNGEERVMKLTLGALAELEATLEEPSLVALVERFEQSRFSAGDVARLITAGLRGGGAEMTLDDVLAAEITGGPMAGAKAAAELLARAFVVPETP